MTTQAIRILALLFATAPLLRAQDAAFEDPPTLSAAAILKPEFAAGPQK